MGRIRWLLGERKKALLTVFIQALPSRQQARTLTFIAFLVTNYPPDPFVDILSISPFLAAVYNGTTHGLLLFTKVANAMFKCSNCSFHPSCDHECFLQGWCDRNDLTDSLFAQDTHSPQDLKTFRSISYCRIPYPLSDNVKEAHDALESGKEQFPVQLIPQLTSDTCIHGNKCV